MALLEQTHLRESNDIIVERHFQNMAARLSDYLKRIKDKWDAFAAIQGVLRRRYENEDADQLRCRSFRADRLPDLYELCRQP